MANALEAWSDALAAQGVPLVIAGDFNRRLNRHHGGGPHERRDAMFLDLDDNAPHGASYVAFPAKTSITPPDRACFAHQEALGHGGLYRPDPIDFILLNLWAMPLLTDEAAQEFDYRAVLGAEFDDQRYSGRQGELLSDHCPLAIDLEDW